MKIVREESEATILAVHAEENILYAVNRSERNAVFFPGNVVLMVGMRMINLSRVKEVPMGDWNLNNVYLSPLPKGEKVTLIQE